MASGKDLQVSTFGYISRCPVQVYEAIADPRQLERYFATGGVSGRLETGSTVYWDFVDFPGAFPVQVVSATQAEHIELRWGQANELRSVNFEFEPLEISPARNSPSPKAVGRSLPQEPKRLWAARWDGLACCPH